jgi:hypothetical protein
MERFQKSLAYVAVSLFFCILPFFTGCSSDSSSPIGSDDRGTEFQAPLAWVWGYDADTETFTAYHSRDDKRATFAANIHSHMQIMYAPSDPQHTIWMGSGHQALAFTAGFTPHGDHGHMETPEKHVATSEVHGCVHMGVSHDGETVAFANDENETFTVIDTETGTVSTVNHGSPHSSALITDGGQLVGVHMQENWARIIDPLTDSVLEEISIGSLAHGDAYHSATDRAFIACAEGIEVIDTVSMAKTKRLDYPDPATVRTYILYHADENPVAVGPAYNTADGEAAETDSFFLLHMTDETLETLTIPGATLDWSKSNGLVDLSKDGRTAVFSDVNAALLYVVDVDPSSDTYRSVTTITTPAAGDAVAVGATAEHLFILSGTTVYPVDLDAAAVDMDGAFTVNDGTDWIYVTSFSGELIDESVDKGDTILNPEDTETHSVVGRLLVADLNDAVLAQVDLDTGEVIEEKFTIDGTASLYASPSGRFGLALQKEPGRVDLYDGGIYLESHGDHYDNINTDLSFMTYFEGVSPVHVVSRGRYMIVHFDKSDTGQVLILDEYQMAMDLEDGNLDESPVRLSPGKQHGAVVPMGDDLFVITTPTPAYLNGETRNPLPHGVHVRNLNDEVLFGISNEANSEGVYERVVVGDGEAACDGLHGEYGNGKTSVFGCRSGVRVVAMAESDGFETFFIDNPPGPDTFYFDEVGAEGRSADEIFSGLRIGSIRGSDHLDHYFGHMTYSESSGGIYLIDPVNRRMTLTVPSDSTQRPTAYDVDHEGKYLFVLMSGGEIRKYDGTTGVLVSEKPDAFTPITDFSDHGKYFPGLTLGLGKVFYTDPKTGTVVQMDMESMEIESTYAVGGEPSELVFLGAVKPMEEPEVNDNGS